MPFQFDQSAVLQLEKLKSALGELKSTTEKAADKAEFVENLLAELLIASDDVASAAKEEDKEEGAEENNRIPKTGRKFVINNNNVLVGSWKTYVGKGCPSYSDLAWLFEGESITCHLFLLSFITVIFNTISLKTISFLCRCSGI